MKQSLVVMAMVLSFGAASAVWAADAVIEAGKKVTLDYTLTVDNQEVETSVGKKPLDFVVGAKTVIPGLESGLMGMHVGEEKVITVAAKDAYGEVDPKAFKEFPKSSMPKGSEPKAGMVLQAQAPDGESFPATISEVKGDKVVLNFNHPLAGKQLKFKVKIVGIEQAPPQAKMPATPASAAK